MVAIVGISYGSTQNMMTWGTVNFVRVAFPNKQAEQTVYAQSKNLSEGMKKLVERYQKCITMHGGGKHLVKRRINLFFITGNKNCYIKIAFTFKFILVFT